MKLSVIVGTRPQLIKISPLVRELEGRGAEFQFIDTGQHYDYELNKTFYHELGLPKARFLDIGSSNPGEQTAKALAAIEKELIKFKPDKAVVIGDTNSTLAGALAAVKQNIPLAHIEAGLRSFDRRMPEEINRVVVDHIADFLFAPTENAIENLKAEGIPEEKVFHTYDITVDACTRNYVHAKENSRILEKLGLKKGDYLLVTAHRQENVDHGKNIEKLVSALLGIQKTMVFPLHPRTEKNLRKYGLYDKIKKHCLVTKPLGYSDFLVLLANAACVLTDSGGIQKEALILKTPCVTLRDSTEWPETLKAGGNILVGLSREKIIREVEKRTSPAFRASLEKTENPFGDGKTSIRILKILLS